MAKKSKAEKADLKAAHVAAEWRHTRLVKALGTLSEVADQPPLAAICATTMAVGLIRGDRRLAETGGRMLASMLLATWLKSRVKHRVDRTRPGAMLDGIGYALEKGSSKDKALNSFPSGHTADAVSVARAIAHGYPGAAVPAYALAGLIAAIQIPRCAHYPTDIGAGALIGLAAEAAVRAAEKGVAARV